MTEPCETCGTRLRDMFRRVREYEPQRLIEVFRSLNEEERIGVHAWLVQTLRRPPFDKPSPAFQALAAVLDALAYDLDEHTQDPLSPEFTAAGVRYVVPVPHPRIVEALSGGA